MNRFKSESKYDQPHVFAIQVATGKTTRNGPAIEILCKCGAYLPDPIHVAARDVPREEEIPFGYPKKCESCGCTIHRSNEHMHLNWMHGDRVGEGPIEFCGIGCLAIYAQHQTDMEATRARA